MALQSREETKRLARGERLEKRTKRRVQIAFGIRVDSSCPQNETSSHEGAAQRRAVRCAVSRPVGQIDDDVGGVPRPARTHGEAGIMRRDVGHGSRVDKPPEAACGEIERAGRRLAVEKDRSRGDARLPGTSQGREEDLTGVSLDRLGAERRRAQSRISSTDSTWTPFSLR